MFLSFLGHPVCNNYQLLQEYRRMLVVFSIRRDRAYEFSFKGEGGGGGG